MKIKKLIAAFLSATVVATSMTTVFATPSTIETGETVRLADSAGIKNVKIDGGKTVVTLEGTGDAVILAAKFNGKVLADIKSSAVTGDTVTIDGIEATKVFVWDSLENAQPICDPFVLEAQTYTVNVASGITGGTVKIVKPEATEAPVVTEAPVETEKPDDGGSTGPVVPAGSSSYFVTAETSPEEGAVYTDDENLTVTNMSSSTVNTNLEKDPGDPITVEMDGNSCCYFLAVRASSTPTSYDTVSGTGNKAPLDIVAKKDGILKIYHRWFIDGRSMAVMEMNDDGTYTNLLVGERTMLSGNILPEGERMVDVEYGYDAFEVEAGKSYIVFATGFTSEVFGWTFTPATAAAASLSADEDLVDTLDVKAGETVTVKAVADDKNASVTVKTTPAVTVTAVEGKAGYYTFTMPSANTTVSATFKTDAVVEAQPHTADFTTMTAVPMYSAEVGSGFTSVSAAILAEGFERKVDPTAITISAEGASITESTGSYLYKKSNSLDGDDYNHGGLIYRVDTGAPGAYRIEVEVADSKNLTVAPTGMQGSRLVGTGAWDTAGGIVPKTTAAKWDGNVWSFDFATGEEFVEIEIEPKNLPTADDPQTVTVKSIKITPLEVNPAGDKPTIHVLGDSTQKTYNFNEQISAWGQTLVNYFNPDKANVINYSMGGRSMKANYQEGRANEALIRGKEGDFVFIHSAHNDETVSTNRFSRGAGIASDLATNNANQTRWLDMYVEMIKARGMTPVLVTPMPRTGNGKYSESAQKPNGFNPDSPGNMRAKAASDPQVALVELYAGAKDYFDKLDPNEVMYIYNNYEAGETPAANYANGGESDGTHYREGASKQFNRIMLQSIYDQSVATEDKYTDKAIMAELVTLMKDEVVEGASTGDWSAAFPEMASDVSAVDVVPGAVKQVKENYYYRNNIEKALQLGLLSKDKDNLFKPTAEMTVGEFARSVEKVFGLEANSLTSYTKTAAELGVAATAEDEVATVATDLADDAVLAEGTATVTITQADGGEITVYNESAFNTATGNISKEPASKAVITDNDFFTFTAPTTIVAGSDKSGVFADNADITGNYVEFRNGDSKEAEYEAKADGILTVYARTGDNKKVELIDTAGEIATQSDYLNEGAGVGSGANVYGTIKFNVKAGTTYQLYTRGGTGRLFGIKYESTNYPQSTSSLDVNVGDTVRVTAYTEKGYVNDSIIINGEAVAEAAGKKEYIFTVTGSTTVTATFIAEPEFVEVTNIPSDAALTREAMGAIMYDAYQIANAANPNGTWHTYFGQNGSVPSPDDPGYDPNIKYEGSPYIPLTGWGALTDKTELSNDLFVKVKEVYNLGLIRPEQGIKRGSIACGNVLEPKTIVTRAKAAKALVFMYILTQEPTSPNQLVPEGRTVNVVDSIAVPTVGVTATPVK